LCLELNNVSNGNWFNAVEERVGVCVVILEGVSEHYGERGEELISPYNRVTTLTSFIDEPRVLQILKAKMV